MAPLVQSVYEKPNGPLTLRLYASDAASDAPCQGELYSDDGKTYAYEKGNSSVTTLHWDDAAGKLTQAGVPVGSVSELLEVVGR